MLTKSDAKKFFGSLYDHSHTPDLSDFESAAIRLVARVENFAAPGDKALGLLMLNHVMTNGAQAVEPAQRGALTAAVLMNIKASAVEGFMQAFPQESLESLVDAAKKAGYQVDVLDTSSVKNVARSAVGR